MSRAFVKEDDTGGIEPLPDRPILPHTNIVTPHGLADIDAHLAELQHRHAAAIKAEDRAALAAIARDLRYWSARRASAQVVKAPRRAVRGRVRHDVDDRARRRPPSDLAHRRRGRSRSVTRHAVLRVAGARAPIGKRVGDVARAGNSDAEIVAIE